jgi:DNA-binding transcriptional LysR family regulator
MSSPYNASGVELRHLRAFVAVAEERNFTRAAARVNLTQPALSRTIAQLERMLGTALFVRDRRSVEPTRATGPLLVHSRRVLAALDDAVTEARGGPSLRVGFTWGSTAEYIAPVVRVFEHEHPEVEVQLTRFDDTLAGLADGRAHLGFVPGVPADDRLRTLVLVDERRVAALATAHPLADRAEVSLNDLAPDNIVINVVSGTTRLDLWDPADRPDTVLVRNVDEWMEAIATGHGVGLTPASTSRLYTHPGIRYIPVSDAPLVPIVLAWPHGPTHPFVEEFVAAAARTHSPGVSG